MDERFNMGYCAWPGCIYGATPGQDYCDEHEKDALDAMLRELGVLAPCRVNERERKELPVLLELDEDELFG